MLQYVAILSPSFASCQPAPNVTVRKFKHAHFSRSQSVPVLKTEATAAMCLKDMDLIHLTHINWDCEGAKLSRGTAWNWAVVLPSNPLSAIKRAEAVLLSLLRTWHSWTLRSFCFVRRSEKPVCVSKQTNKQTLAFIPSAFSIKLTFKFKLLWSARQASASTIDKLKLLRCKLLLLRSYELSALLLRKFLESTPLDFSTANSLTQTQRGCQAKFRRFCSCPLTSIDDLGRGWGGLLVSSAKHCL